MLQFMSILNVILNTKKTEKKEVSNIYIPITPPCETVVASPACSVDDSEYARL